MGEFDCDIVHVLENRDFNVLEKLVSHCYNFRAKVTANIQDATAYEIGCMGKKSQSVEISELQQEIESLKFEIDAIKIQQENVDKKINDAVKQQEKLKQDINDEKVNRNQFSHEIVELQQESEKRKEHKISTWNAIKSACQTYKQYLNFRIHLINNDKEQEHIKVSFFINGIATVDKYFVHLINCNNKWRVEQIQPMLKKEHLSNFDGIVNFSNQSEIFNITAFLCRLRHVFLKYYLNRK